MPFQRALQDGEQQVCYQCRPYLCLDGVCGLPIEVPQREILFYLLEERLYPPTPAVYPDYSLGRHVEIVGKEGNQFGALPLLHVDVGDYTGNVVYAALAEDDHLLPAFHEAFRVLEHEVDKRLVFEILLHLCDIHHAIVGEFLEFCVVDTGTVHSDNVVMRVMPRGEHEGIVRGGGGELYVARHVLVAFEYGVNLYPALLPACLGMASGPLEYGVGKQCDGCRIYNPEPLYPCCRVVTAAVR